MLQSPEAATEQDGLGNPQKAPPCGDNGDAIPTGIVTTYQAGDTITVTIDETIYHPGHYRIALALNDPSELPDPPPVTPADTPCGSAPIDPAPVFPVLADGVFEHNQPFGAPQSIDITLPDDIECTNCTLQIIQFMSNHGLNNPGGCYYHHCATIEIEPAGPSSTTTPGGDTTDGSMDDTTTNGPAGTTSGGDPSGTGGGGGGSSGAAVTGDPTTGVATNTDSGQPPMDSDGDGGCGCSVPRGSRGAAGFLLGLLGLLALRRRRG